MKRGDQARITMLAENTASGVHVGRSFQARLVYPFSSRLLESDGRDGRISMAR